MCHVIRDISTGRYYTGKKLQKWGKLDEAKRYSKHEAQCVRGGLRNTKALSTHSLIIVKIEEEVQHG